ncbi:MAG: thiosulfate sulfurtransferase [Deltaproteobacteria bacterium]|nr:thiosulfate sulfurtransferase [Deltaproteobacteria bacterium]
MQITAPSQVKKKLSEDEELALIDVREEGVFSEGHQLFANCLPLSCLELKIRDLVPRYSTQIILVDQGPSDPLCLAEEAARRLDSYGYTNIAIMEGGIQGWGEAGFEVFTGVNVPSKAFGEFVEHTYQTPNISAEELKAKMEVGEKLIVLDSRPKEEYFRMNIPGGINVPGAELAYRIHDLAPNPEYQIVVNCAGRTRSIIGAQSLINANIPNSVVALKNGTMGWALAGYELEHKQDRLAPPPSEAGLIKVRVCVDHMAKKFGIKKVTRSMIDTWQREADRNTTYLLDVRLPEEFEAGHIKGSRNAPGGQLVQATDEYMAVGNARVVLVDDTELRAVMTASWLFQIGWNEVYVCEGGIGNSDLVSGTHRAKIPGFEKGLTLTPQELNSMIESGDQLAVLDLANSVEYWERHIPGAWWGVRSRLLPDISLLPETSTMVLTSPDSIIAHLAYKDLKEHLGGLSLRVLEEGTRAWIDEGLPTAEGMEKTITKTDDVWLRPYEHTGKMTAFMHDYLKWETGLIEQINRDGDTRFRPFS